jgi:branched-chain amino acid transport system ATP-binding protein
MTAVLDVDGLTAGFGANQVLHGVDLRIERGGAGVLLGLNGAGKSVTLKCLSGLLPAWGGAVSLEGRELLWLEAEDRVRAGLGHVLQTKAVFPYLSVAENLRLGGAVVRQRDRYRANLERVYGIYPRLAERRRQAAGNLSGGEQAMLAVARALMAEPRLLLIDEPSAGLSPLMVGQLAETLHQVRASGTTLLLVEQNVGFALELAEEVFVLEKGRVVYRGRAAHLDRDRIATLLGIGELLSDSDAGAAGLEATAPRRPRPLHAERVVSTPRRANGADSVRAARTAGPAHRSRPRPGGSS